MQSAETAIAAALAAHLPLGELELLELLETPPSPQMGDCALPCFALAGRLKQPPRQIAADLADKVGLPDDVLRVQAEGPYLNFFLDRPRAAERVLRRIRAEADAYGGAELGRGRTVVIEFSSPNIAKHLGVHHLPSSVIGMSLCRLFDALGYEVVGLNFLGDWGTGFGRLIAAIERCSIEEPQELTVGDLQDLYVRYSQEAEDEPELQEAARAAFRRLEEGDPEATNAWEGIREVSLREFARVYGKLGIRFDAYTPESMYRDKIQPLLGRLLADGLAERSEGALVVPLEEKGLPPCMVQKSDGASLYVTRDIPAAEDRWERYRFERALYVVGNEQSLYFQQLRAVLDKMGHRWADRIMHVNFGLLKFVDADTGEARVGSTRRGEVLLLEEILDDAVCRARLKIEGNRERFDAEADLDELAARVGIGAVIFRQLATRRTSDIVFEWDRVLDFEGDTGPYVQYAHARLCSILRKAGQQVSEAVDFSLLELPEEWTLVRHLGRFPSTVRRAAELYEPSLIATYLLELCADFSTYYSVGMPDPERRVLCEDRDVRAARLLLVDAMRHVIRNGLELLGVSAPERM